MGHSEYDRIRSKNRSFNQAQYEFDYLKSAGLSNQDILSLCEKHKPTATGTRYEIISALIKLAGREHVSNSNY